MQYTLLLWHADHANFERLMMFLERELSQSGQDAEPDYALIADIMYYMTHYADALHHPKEDVVFARMKARDAALGPSIDELTHQHERLRAIGADLVRLIDEVLNGSIVPRNRLQQAAHAYVDALRTHMRTEERAVLPAAARLLTDADWAQIDATIANFDDPVFGSAEHDRYTRLREHINAEARRDDRSS